MSVVAIVVLVILGVLLLLAIVGSAMASLRNRRRDEHLTQRLREVDRELAAALAQDRGWEREALDTAARQAFAEHRPGVAIAELELLQVVDRPGIGEDQAVLRADAVEGATRITLARRSGDGGWYAAAVEDER
jgi:type II secretory pathway pseudopilin PulG